MQGSLPRLSSCLRGKLALGPNEDSVKICLLFFKVFLLRLQVSRVYIPLPWSPSCSGSVSGATQRGVSTGRLLCYIHPIRMAINTQDELGMQVQFFLLLLFLRFCNKLFPSLLSFIAGSRCCFTFNKHAQGSTRGYRGGNTLMHRTVLSSSFNLQWWFERWRTFCLCYLSGWFGFHTQIHQKWCGQGESKTGPHSAGSAGQGTKSPSVSHSNTQLGLHESIMHLVDF